MMNFLIPDIKHEGGGWVNKSTLLPTTTVAERLTFRSIPASTKTGGVIAANKSHFPLHSSLRSSLRRKYQFPTLRSSSGQGLNPSF